MARQNRKYGQSGIYHAILRGVNKQRIFEWNDDYQAFMRILKRAQTTSIEGIPEDEPNFDIYAYCLMDNHVHLLLGERSPLMPLPNIMKRLAGGYARYFNTKYMRVGHLFQERYHSEPCDDDNYFFKLLDYIHQNPVKAGLVNQPDQYEFSSYADLAGEKVAEHLCSTTPPIYDLKPNEIRDYVRSQVEPDGSASLLARALSPIFRLLQVKKENDPYKYDRAIVETLCELSGVENISAFQRLDKKTMRSALAQVRDSGVSIRHLSRLTGISEGVIRYSK